MSRKIRELITKYVSLQEEIFKLEDKILECDCIYRKLVEPIKYDHAEYHICENKMHIHSRSVIALCSLKYCPFKIIPKKGDVYDNG